MESTHHTIADVELAADDLAVSTAFYAAAFGWSVDDYGPTYAGIRASSGDGEVGGLNTSNSGGPGGALVLLTSDDVDASLAAVETTGGRVVTPVEAYSGGRRFTFADPAGTVLGVFQSD
ncbi:VOC family protein [Nocardioides guangzhouensis]|uniref:VOC family protein n=1 Tax=Nocardioides guangzhouensis TaxID=2497878 RepID=A0A4Q4ZH07_9ACTN|nr:VOC family protein [Nocardioides guangzhouensis]RYP87497.1 VOC family protein [Nocardioides guangzhouensis]